MNGEGAKYWIVRIVAFPVLLPLLVLAIVGLIAGEIVNRLLDALP